MVALLVFIMSYLDIVFGRKKLLNGKGPFDDNVSKIRLGIYSLKHVITSGAKNVRGKMQRVLLTN